jgi:ethanolamine utilization protein EutQ (cupin superfamily)
VVRIIEAATEIQAAGQPPKIIREYVGRANSDDSALSIALMESPEGWCEPPQTPAFDEYTLVLGGTLRVETEGAAHDVTAGQAVIAEKSTRVRYSTPYPGGARYVAVCLPAFSPETVHRDED